MPFALEVPTLALLACALLGAAYVRGYSGFGFSAIFIAIAALVTNPLPLIPVVFGCELLMTLVQGPGVIAHVDWRRVGALLAGAALVLPVSVGLILSMGEAEVRLAVSLVIFVLAGVLATGWVLERRIGAAGHLGVGALAGAANAAGVGGLPVATFLTAQPIPAPVFRASMVAFLTGIDLITLPLMWAGGLVTGDTLMALAAAFPIAALGVWLGGRRFGAASPTSFRRMAIALLLTLSGIGLVRGALA